MTDQDHTETRVFTPSEIVSISPPTGDTTEADTLRAILAELRAIRALMEARNSAGLRIASVPGIGA